MYWSPNDGALVSKNIFGVKPTFFMARTKPTPSAKVAPCTTTSGFFPFTALAIESKLLVSAGYVLFWPVSIPAPSNFSRMPSRTGPANGSSSVGRAAVRLDIEHAVALRDRRRRDVEQ